MDVGNVTLRAYQAKDVERLTELGGTLVSYDKRGGKTITALAIAYRLLASGHSGPVLIIADKPSPWSRDLEKIGISAERIHLVDRPKRVELQAALDDPQPGHFYQIHWSGIVPEFARLMRVNWLCILADELHAAKNRNSKRTKALKKLRTHFKIGLTADPADNVPQDVWSLLNWLYPKRYSSFWRWVRQYVEVSEKSGKSGKYFVFGDPINIEQFQAEIAEFYTSMTLAEIDPGQLPTQYEVREVVMTPEQAEAYRQMVDYQMAMIDDELLITEWPMVNANRLQQLAQSMGKVETHKVWKTRRHKDPTTGKLATFKSLEEVSTLHQVEPSPKVDELIRVLRGDPPTGPVIVFSTFPGIIDIACKRMSAEGINSYYHVISSGDDLVEGERAFQRGDVDIIIGTVGIMGESIELSRADTVIFLDCPWSPRVRSQAEARANEVGKRTPIRCIDIKTRDTVDFERLGRVQVKGERNDTLLGKVRLPGGR